MMRWASNNERRQAAPPQKPYFALAMLAMALVVGGLAVMVAVRGVGISGKPHDNGDSGDGQSQAQEVCTRARPLVENGLFTQARDLAMAYVARHPLDADVRPLLAEAQIGLGELQEAQGTLDDLLKLAPEQAQGNWLMARLLKLRKDAAYIRYLKCAADCEDARAEMAADYGRDMLERDDLPKARSYLQTALDRGDRSAATLAAMGNLEMRQGEPAKAVGLLRESLKSQPRNPAAWELLVCAHRALNQVDLAAKAVDEGLKHQPSGQLLMDKAVLLLRANDKLAAQTFEQAAAYTEFETVGDIAAARAWLAQGRYAQAMYCIDRAMDRPGVQEMLCGWAAWCAVSVQGAAAPLAVDPLSIIQLKSQIEDLRFGRPTRR